MKKYVVSKDTKSGLWYAHREDLPHVPIVGSFSEKKSESKEYVKMWMEQSVILKRLHKFYQKY